MLTDPIADFLTRVRNASHAGRSTVAVRSSRMIKSITQVLIDKHFIVDMKENAGELTLTLPSDRDPLELRRISKPGQRIYVAHNEIKRVRNGLGIGVISTSKGIISDGAARKAKIGGEYICEIY